MADYAAQQTLAAPSISVRGVGLHSGKPVTLRLLPAASDSGIVVWRRDLGNNARLRCSAHEVADTMLSTCIGKNTVRVDLVEHLLSALCAAEVDNVTVAVDGSEIPGMDGSARPFLLMLAQSGLVAQDRPRKKLRVLRRTEVRQQDSTGERMASFSPYEGSRWEIEVDFAHPQSRMSGRQFEYEHGDDYDRRIAAARTFGFVRDLDMLRRNSRALGGSLDNALVLDGARVLNPEGLRYSNELVRHKMLDVIGDCYVNGYRVLGRYVASRPGHKLNNMLMRKLLDSEGACEMV